jgi:hypothetical protein
MKRTRWQLLSAAMAMAIPVSAQWLNYPTAGIPRGPDGKTDLSAPAPRTADGKPDLSGVWQADSQEFFMNLASGLKEDELSMQPWASALQRQRVERDHGEDPLARCLPHGVPRINTNGLFPFKIIQTPQEIVILYEQLYLFRQIFLDGRKLANNPNPAWLGYSTGRWDGDSLVVEVHDTGPGISPALRARLFQPFVTAGKKNGLGLGLALSRQTLLDHGGDMWADSDGPGAKFCLRLPRERHNVPQEAVNLAGD